MRGTRIADGFNYLCKIVFMVVNIRDIVQNIYLTIQIYQILAATLKECAVTNIVFSKIHNRDVTII